MYILNVEKTITEKLSSFSWNWIYLRSRWQRDNKKGHKPFYSSPLTTKTKNKNTQDCLTPSFGSENMSSITFKCKTTMVPWYTNLHKLEQKHIYIIKITDYNQYYQLASHIIFIINECHCINTNFIWLWINGGIFHLKTIYNLRQNLNLHVLTLAFFTHSWPIH